MPPFGPMQFFEDIKVGAPRGLDRHMDTEEAITDFAAEYNPLPFHTDRVAAAETVHGELNARVYQTPQLPRHVCGSKWPHNGSL